MAVGDHTIERARGAWMPHADRLAQAAMQVWHLGRPVLLSFLLVAATTLVLLGIDRVFGIAHVSIAYVLPVLVAATMLGLVPALVVAVAAVAVSAFFFYPPIYDFRVASPQQLIDLTMFVIVAVTTGQLAAAARANAARAREREAEIRALYNFSRRLAVATEPAEISAAVQDHLSAMTGRRVVYFAADQPASPSDRRQSGPSVPNAIRDAVDRLASARTADGLTVADAETGTRWLVRSVSPRNPEYGLLAIDMGDAGDGEPSAMHARIDAAPRRRDGQLRAPRRGPRHQRGAPARGGRDAARGADGLGHAWPAHAAVLDHRLGVDPGGDARRGGRRALGKPGRHRARRGRAARSRHPAARRRHPHQQRRRAPASGLGRSRRHRQRGARAPAPRAWPGTRSSCGCPRTCRWCTSIRC